MRNFPNGNGERRDKTAHLTSRMVDIMFPPCLHTVLLQSRSQLPPSAHPELAFSAHHPQKAMPSNHPGTGHLSKFSKTEPTVHLLSPAPACKRNPEAADCVSSRRVFLIMPLSIPFPIISLGTLSTYRLCPPILVPPICRFPTRFRARDTRPPHPVPNPLPMDST